MGWHSQSANPHVAPWVPPAAPVLAAAHTPPPAQAQPRPRPARTGGGSSGPSAAPRGVARSMARWGAGVKVAAAGLRGVFSRRRRVEERPQGALADSIPGAAAEVPAREGAVPKPAPHGLLVDLE